MEAVLVFRIRERVCGVPVRHVLETFRPLAAEPLEGAPEFVVGVTMLRGEPVPVVDARRLLGVEPGQAGRCISLGIDGRVIALAVDEILGIRSVSSDEIPPLLQGASDGVIAQIASLDGQLLLVLGTARLLSKAELPS